MPAGIEIERRFLVHNAPLEEARYCEVIRQGYLAIDEQAKSSVRIRQKDQQYILTVKSGSGLSKREEEFAIDGSMFSRLWPMAQSASLEKKRHVIPHGGRHIEVDVFEGSLSGLVIAEVEFESVEEAKAFVPPPWVDREVTNDPEFTNASLARNGNPLDLTANRAFEARAQRL